MAQNNPYLNVIIETYYPDSTSGLHGDIHARPIEGQGYPKNMHVSCSKKLKNKNYHAVGTKFKLKAKLTNRKSGGKYLYARPKAPYEVIK